MGFGMECLHWRPNKVYDEVRDGNCWGGGGSGERVSQSQRAGDIDDNNDYDDAPPPTFFCYTYYYLFNMIDSELFAKGSLNLYNKHRTGCSFPVQFTLWYGLLIEYALNNSHSSLLAILHRVCWWWRLPHCAPSALFSQCCFPYLPRSHEEGGGGGGILKVERDDIRLLLQLLLHTTRRSFFCSTRT